MLVFRLRKISKPNKIRIISETNSFYKCSTFSISKQKKVIFIVEFHILNIIAIAIKISIVNLKNENG